MRSYDLKIAQLLAKNRIFKGLTPHQIDEMLPCIVQRIQTYHDKEYVYQKGEVVRDLGIVLKGGLMLAQYESDLTGNLPKTISPNGMFGEMVVFSTSGSVPHGVIAQEETQVLFLSADFFLQQCGKDCVNKGMHAEVVRNLLQMLADNAIMLNKKITYLTAPDLKTKIAMYLCELYDLNGVITFNMPLNRDRLASFFSVARPSLSRELMNLKNQNMIDFYRSSVKILDLAALRQLARGESYAGDEKACAAESREG